MTLSFVGMYIVNPISIRTRVLVCSNLYTISTMKHSLDGHQLAVDAGIYSVLTYLAMNLVSKIQCSSTFREDYAFALWSEDHNIVIIERRSNTIHIVHILAVECNILQHAFELFEPLRYILFCTLSCATQTRSTHHSLR